MEVKGLEMIESKGFGTNICYLIKIKSFCKKKIFMLFKKKGINGIGKTLLMYS